MAGELYLHDSYARDMRASIRGVTSDGVILGNTIFYPQGGGQPFDTGTLRLLPDGASYTVTEVTKRDGQIVHIIGPHSLREHDVVELVIDWPRRYAHMRYHTAAHILASVLHRVHGALITGNQITEERLRIDFALDEYDSSQLQRAVVETNRIIAEHHDVYVRFLERDQALTLPGIVKLAGAHLPDIPVLRVVTIGNPQDPVDEQADGGTHVRNTRELAPLEVVSTENKGKNNRRVYVRFTTTSQS
jgi:misacylated tRNA(Ala) deacylase